MRVAIAGGPKTGKTTMAAELGPTFTVRHTDDLIHLGWSEASAAVVPWFEEEGPWIVEGVAVPRALRKWLRANPEGKPCDRVVFLTLPFRPLSTGQAAMTKGVAKVWDEIEGELRARGVVIA